MPSLHPFDFYEIFLLLVCVLFNIIFVYYYLFVIH